MPEAIVAAGGSVCLCTNDHLRQHDLFPIIFVSPTALLGEADRPLTVSAELGERRCNRGDAIFRVNDLSSIKSFRALC
jgi:hypothetical protein